MTARLTRSPSSFEEVNEVEEFKEAEEVDEVNKVDDINKVDVVTGFNVVDEIDKFDEELLQWLTEELILGQFCKPSLIYRSP